MWKSQTLSTAVELGLFDYLSKSPHKTKEEICRDLNFKAKAPEDLFDALVSMHYLDRNDDGIYSNTKDTEIYCVSTSPMNLCNLVMMRGCFITDL